MLRIIQIVALVLCSLPVAAQHLVPLWNTEIYCGFAVQFYGDELMKQTAQSNYYLAFENQSTTITVNDSVINGENGVYIVKLDSNGELIWLNRIARYNSARVWDIAVDKDENLYVAGHVFDSCWYGTDTLYRQSFFNNDGFVLKIGSNGQLLSKAQYSSPSYWVTCHNLAVDDDLNVYVIGMFYGAFPDGTDTLYSWPGPGTSFNFFIKKLDAALQTVWSKHLYNPSVFGFEVKALFIDTASNVCIGGNFNGKVFFSPTDSLETNLSNHRTIFFVKLDGNGGLVLKKQYGSMDYINRIATNGQGTHVLLGYYGAPLNIDTLVSTQGNTGYAAALDDQGGAKWISTYGHELYGEAASGKHAFGGSTTYDLTIIDGDTTLLDNNNCFVPLLICYDVDFGYKWHHVMPGSGGYCGYYIAATAAQNTLTTWYGLSGFGTWWVGSEQIVGNGLHRLQLTKWQLQATSNDNSVPPPKHFIRLYPNPTSDQLTVQLDAGTSRQLTFEVCDVTGRVLRRFVYMPAQPGVNRLSLDTQGLAPGSYHVRVSDGESLSIFKFIKM